MPVQTSIYSNYITIGLKFLNYKKYHLHAFVDTGFEYSLAKRYAIPEEYWEKSSRTVTGVTMEENKIVMDTMARNVRVSLGGGNFTIKIFWQCEGQTADLLIRNDFLLQQTVIQKPEMIGFEKNQKFYWESRLTNAVRVTGKGFIDQYQKSPAKSGDYKPILKLILLLQEKLKGHSEILVNEAISSEDSESEENSECQSSDNESSNGEEEYIREHNLKPLELLKGIMNGDKNYLSDTLIREMTIFERECRNPRSRKPVSEEKKLWERYKNGDKTIGPLHDGPDYQNIVSYEAAESSQSSERIKPRLDQGWDDLSNYSKKDADQSVTSDEEKLANEFLLCPKRTASIDWSDVKRPASPSQTADSKGISKNEAHLLHTLKALTEELYGFHTKEKGVQAENQAGNSKAIYLENPKSAKIPMLALKESERLIQSPVQRPAITGGNGRPNQSIPWMKAMTIAIIKDVVLRDYDSSLLASGEKIMRLADPPLKRAKGLIKGLKAEEVVRRTGKNIEVKYNNSVHGPKTKELNNLLTKRLGY
ncbi:hypothetical protein ACLB2K_021162 [Fragaria x ananassa]